MRAFSLHAADVLESARRLGRGIIKRKLAPIIFAGMLAGSLWLVLSAAEQAATEEVQLGLEITPGSLVFSAFFLALGKGAADTFYRMVRNPTLVFALSQPVRWRSIVAAKLGTVLSANLSFLALCLGTVTALILGFRMRVPAGGPFVPALVAAVVAGLCTGFAFAVAASLSTWRRKALALAALGLFPAAAWVALVQEDLGGWGQLFFTAILVPCGLAVALASHLGLSEAWNAQAATPSSGVTRTSRALTAPLLSARASALFDKEVKTAWRRREIVLSLATLFFVGVALSAVYLLLPGPPAGRFARFLLPTLVMAGVYAGAAVTLTVRGLSSIGGEHESLWIVRTNPVHGREVVVGKAAAYLLIVPGVVAASLPVPLLAGFPWDTTVLVALGAWTIAFVMAAVGVTFGTRAPNFDRNTGGLPDSLTMYGVFIVGLLACAVLLFPMANLFFRDRVLGLLASVLVADLAVLVLVLSVRGAGPRIDALEM